MSITLTIITIASCLATGTAIGIARRDKRAFQDDIDDCIIMYAGEDRCACPDDELFNVEPDQRGRAICINCGKVRV